MGALSFIANKRNTVYINSILTAKATIRAVTVLSCARMPKGTGFSYLESRLYDNQTTWDLMNFWSTAYKFWALTQEPEYRASSPGPKGKGKNQDSCILATVVHGRCKAIWGGHLDGCPSSSGHSGPFSMEVNGKFQCLLTLLFSLKQ